MIDKQEMLRLYHEGLNPSEIAEHLGSDRDTIRKQIWMRGLSVICPKNDKVVRDMYNTGASDLEISIQIRCHISAVGMWRRRNKLKRHRRHRKEVMIV